MRGSVGSVLRQNDVTGSRRRVSCRPSAPRSPSFSPSVGQDPGAPSPWLGGRAVLVLVLGEAGRLAVAPLSFRIVSLLRFSLLTRILGRRHAGPSSARGRGASLGVGSRCPVASQLTVTAKREAENGEAGAFTVIVMNNKNK